MNLKTQICVCVIYGSCGDDQKKKNGRKNDSDSSNKHHLKNVKTKIISLLFDDICNLCV